MAGKPSPERLSNFSCVFWDSGLSCIFVMKALLLIFCFLLTACEILETLPPPEPPAGLMGNCLDDHILNFRKIVHSHKIATIKGENFNLLEALSSYRRDLLDTGLACEDYRNDLVAYYLGQFYMSRPPKVLRIINQLAKQLDIIKSLTDELPFLIDEIKAIKIASKKRKLREKKERRSLRKVIQRL